MNGLHAGWGMRVNRFEGWSLCCARITWPRRASVCSGVAELERSFHPAITFTGAYGISVNVMGWIVPLLRKFPLCSEDRAGLRLGDENGLATAAAECEVRRGFSATRTYMGDLIAFGIKHKNFPE
jgi:hypothetical protein